MEYFLPEATTYENNTSSLRKSHPPTIFDFLPKEPKELYVLFFYIASKIFKWIDCADEQLLHNLSFALQASGIRVPRPPPPPCLLH